MFRQKILLIIIDAFAIVTAFFLIYSGRYLVSPIQPLSFYLWFLVFSVLSFILSLTVFGIYRKRILFSINFFIDMLRAIFLWGFLLLAFVFFIKSDYSRAVVLAFMITAIFFVFFLRFIAALAAPNIFSSGGEDEILSRIRKITPLMYENGFIVYNHGFFAEVGTKIAFFYFERVRYATDQER